MSDMRKLVRFPLPLFAGLLLLLSTGCSSVSMPKGSSKGYTTFKFFAKPPVGDQRFEEPSSLRDQATQSAIRQAMEDKGITLSRESADLVVSYLYIRQDNVSTKAIPAYYGADYQEIQSLAHKKGVLDQPDMGYFDKGAIVIDIMDTRARKLVYRNFAVRDIDGITDEAQLKALIESAVNEALSTFFR